MTPFLHPKLSLYQLAWPTDWTTLFGVTRPLIVEIGFGNGSYLVELAQQHTDYNVIGLEIANRSLEKAERKLSLLGLDNARVVFSRAESALAHLFTARSIRECYINYPDPWFKTRHSGRRLIQRDTLDWLVSRLEIGGKLYLATDIVEYARMSHELLADTPALKNLLDRPWSNTADRLVTTKYEAKGLAAGRGGHYFAYERTDAPHAEPPPQKELAMPHVIISTPMLPQAIIAAHRVQEFQPEEGIYIKLRDAFLHQNQRAMMFEVEIIEPTLNNTLRLCCTRVTRKKPIPSNTPRWDSPA